MGHDDPGVLGGSAFPGSQPRRSSTRSARERSATRGRPRSARRSPCRQPTLAVAGDGGFLYGVQELATRAAVRSADHVLLVDDGGYGILREYQRDSFGETLAVDLVQPDFVAARRGLRRSGRADGARGLGDALDRALGRGPAVVVLPARLEMWTPTPDMTRWNEPRPAVAPGVEPYGRARA